MDVKITMLDVKDGDAIIVELTKIDKTLVMVIDAGNPSSYTTKVKPKLEEVLLNHNKKAPEIVVCTHYDSDHIGGLIPLIKDYINNVQEVWIHRTNVHINTFIAKAVHLLNEKKKHIGDYNLHSYNKLFENYQPLIKQTLETKADFILESLNQLKKLYNLIPTSKLRQVFHREQPLKDWPEIVVLGPTEEYYNLLFPSNMEFEYYIKEESKEAILSEKRLSMQQLELYNILPCDYLKTDSQTSLTPTNKASIIIAIDNDNDRYLFTGDAGIDSFKNIPNWNEELKDLYFLKIPHHGSDNNISKEIIEIMQPKYAYNSGDRYQDEAVLKCIESKERNEIVMSTKTNGDLFFHKPLS